MNIFERQAELSRTMFEINTNAMQAMAKTGQESIQKYIDMNTEFGQRLPEVRDVTTFMEMQREYGEAFWSTMRSTTESQAEVLKTATEETSSALRKAFAPEA